MEKILEQKKVRGRNVNGIKLVKLVSKSPDHNVVLAETAHRIAHLSQLAVTEGSNPPITKREDILACVSCRGWGKGMNLQVQAGDSINIIVLRQVVREFIV